MDFKLSWALLVVLLGMGLGYFGRGIVLQLRGRGAGDGPLPSAAPPPSWIAYTVAQWADQVLMYLHSKLVPPPYMALQLATSHFTSQALHLATKLGIADLIGDNSKTVGELAKANDVIEDNLYRVLRTLSSLGYFVETSPRTFRNTDLSSVLRKDHPSSVRNLVMAYHDHIHWGASDGMLLTLTQGVVGWRKYLPDESLWDYYEDNTSENEVFNQAMAETNALRGTAVLADYDFGQCQHVVDVGGGRGKFVSMLLRKYPNMTATIYDQQHVVDEATLEWRHTYSQILPDYQVRVTMKSGDFTKSVPSGGDCYVLKGVLSLLDDEQAVLVLNNIAQAVPPQGMLTLIEADLVPPHDQRPLNLALDLAIMTVHNPHGAGRTQEQVGALLGRAGFPLTRVVETRSIFNVVEARRG